ncbi:MAG: PepSY-like domain-containing protein [Flavobacteriales bacterium]|jgi:hypothetical protein|nr:PepSY-like domain-containing protein [Flavobacteriales bacterium]
MKTLLSLAVATLTTGATLHAQQLTTAQLPGPVTAAFNQAFPMAMDVEWKMKGEQYKVEFETGLLFTDHEVWYDATGKLLRHEEEISTSELPAAVSAAIAKEFAGYRMDDAERVTTDGVASYVVELKMSGQPEWKVVYGADGKQLQKQAD